MTQWMNDSMNKSMNQWINGFIKDCIESMKGWLKYLKGWDTKLDLVKKCGKHFQE